MTDYEKTRLIHNVNEADAQTRIVNPQAEKSTSPTNSPNEYRRAAPPATRLVARPSMPNNQEPQINEDARPIAGWLVVISGPGRGKYAPIFDNMNSIGRDPDQSTRLDFGDETISRNGQAFITYDVKDRIFYISHGGKPNLVRLNGQVVLQPNVLNARDKIEIGNTTLQFMPFCGPDFDWQDEA